jgi:MFS family permease
VAWPLLFRERFARRPPGDDRSRWIVLTTVLTGLFAVGFSITIIAVSLGAIARDLGSSTTLLTWAVTGPLLALALAMPLFGKLGDAYGHRRVYLLGLTGFAIASALTPLAWNGPSLVALRLLGGLAGAATGPTSMAIVMRAFPQEDRVRAMGWWSFVGSGAPVIGLVAGGPIVDSIGWRGIFAMQSPLAFVGVAGGALLLHETARAKPEPIDWPGAATLAATTLTLLLGLNLGNDLGWDHPAVLALLTVSPIALVTFLSVERRSPAPLIPLDLFGPRTFRASLAAQWAANFAYMGGFIVTPLLVQRFFGFSVAAASLAMVCRPLTFSLSAPAAGLAAVRVGERRSAVTGLVLLAVSMACFVVAASRHEIALVFVGLALSGLALGASSPSLITAAANTVEVARLGVANAVQQMVVQIGQVMGIQVLATVAAGGTGAGAFAWAYAAGCVVAVAASAPRPSCHQPRGPRSCTSCAPLDLSLGDALDRPQQRGVRSGRCARGLRGHHLGEVALDADLAGHERLHRGVRVGGREHLLRCLVIGRDGRVGVGRMTDADVTSSAA